MERPKTNSITHLVKILIAEELHKVLPEIHDRLAELEKIEDELENAGSSWDMLEDRKLYQELDCFITRTAKRHKRGDGVIHSRIKMLFKTGVYIG